MSTVRKQIMPFVNLTCIETDKFKTGTLSLNLLARLDKATAAKNALLPSVLRRGTAMYPDMTIISKKLQNLYGAHIEPAVRKKGEVQAFGFYADFIDDDFLPKGENVLESVAELLGEMLLEPVTRNGMLKNEFVDSEKKNLINEIRAGMNNKRVYAVNRLLASMCRDEAYGVNKLGTEESVEKITAQSLTKHYKEILKTSVIEIIYCGSAGYDRVEAALLKALSALPRQGAIVLPTTQPVLYPKKNEVRNVVERLDVSQGNLALGFRLGEAMQQPKAEELMVFNAVYGGSVTSRLFLNVREKLSLCYYASSALDRIKGIMYVSSGIEFEKYDEALDEILAQLAFIAAGDVEAWELESAIKMLITNLKMVTDGPDKLDDYYLGIAVQGVEVSPLDLAALVSGVKMEAVIETAKNVKLDTIYFLTAAGGDGDEA